MHDALVILRVFWGATLPILRNWLVLGVAFAVLARLSKACNPGAPWWRKPDLATDFCFAVVPRLPLAYGQTAMLTLGATLVYGIGDPTGVDAFIAHGRGPLAGLAFWQQVALYLLGNDLVLYWTHRGLHTMRLWRFHAVHHSSEQLEWTSAHRFHPVDFLFHSVQADVIMLLLGIPPEVLVWLAPWSVGTACLAHANLDWDFGRFRYVLASPVFHRWHHTSLDCGGGSNFAGAFPVFDLTFGTFYMPAGQRPNGYGVDEPDYPRHFLGQLIAPFRRGRAGRADAVGPVAADADRADEIAT